MQITGIENRHSSRVTQRCALEHGVLRVAGLQVVWSIGRTTFEVLRCQEPRFWPDTISPIFRRRLCCRGSVLR